MVVLGINAYGHDSAAALLVDGEVTAACEEEKLSRIKHDGAFPVKAVQYCLDEGGVEPSDIDCIGFYHDPFLHIGRRICHWIGALPGSFHFFTRQKPAITDWRRMFTVQKTFRRACARDAEGFEFHLLDHHLTHAAGAFFLSPFEEAAILSVDGMGEWTATLLAEGRGNRITKIREIFFPHSLGIFYETVTQYLGFQMHNDEYKVMGLAAYGEPRFESELSRAVPPDPCDERLYRLDGRYFGFWHGDSTFYSDRLRDMLGPPRDPADRISQRHCDIACSLQRVLTTRLQGLLQWLKETTGHENLCFTGGVALNCMANGALLRSSPFENIFVQPAAGDAGCSVGSALLIYHHLFGKTRRKPVSDVFWGPAYSAPVIRHALEAEGYDVTVLHDPAAEAAERLHNGQIIGWFQGKLEFGPRALGHRSILADPRMPGMKDRINEKIKLRESFRPFAPSVLAAHAHEYFCDVSDSPFMLYTFLSRPEVRDSIPGIIHVDGSSRIHTVSEENDPLFYRLISCFLERTGVPLVLNTSFNQKGEPIVCSPRDALRCFVKSGLDAVILDQYLVENSIQ
jgi:carbamoyltransferase